MKRLFTLITLVLLIGFNLRAQTCMPDTSLLDSIQFIYPEPFDAEANPDGGIPDTACAGRPFDYTFTVLVPDTLSLQGFTLPVVALSFATEGAITYDPPLSNFDYTCDPPNCVFLPNEPGCVRIFGQPTATDIGAHELMFSGSANLGIVIPVTFPDENLFPGNYQVVVQAADSPYCMSASVSDRILRGFEIRNSPNPFGYTTDILISAERSGRFAFQVFDLLGKQVHQERLDLQQGDNSVTFDGSNLPNGMYLFSLTDGRASLTKRMIVSR